MSLEDMQTQRKVTHAMLESGEIELVYSQNEREGQAYEDYEAQAKAQEQRIYEDYEAQAKAQEPSTKNAHNEYVNPGYKAELAKDDAWRVQDAADAAKAMQRTAAAEAAKTKQRAQLAAEVAVEAAKTRRRVEREDQEHRSRKKTLLEVEHCRGCRNQTA